MDSCRLPTKGRNSAEDDYPMTFTDRSAVANESGRAWAKKLTSYRTADDRRALFELLVSALPFAGLWSLMAFAIEHDLFWLYALLVLPTAGFLIRLFLIQHDCGHGSFFSRKTTNDWVGRVLGVFTITPYDHWRRGHALHHATAGNLTRRGVGDVDTLTITEYEARSPLGRLRYWAYRHPIVLFCIGPAYLFVFQNRWPAGASSAGWEPWLSTMITNLAILVLATGVVAVVGLQTFLWVEIPTLMLAATAGVWLFYVQHQFENTFWAESAEWDVHDAALRGSSHYDLPQVLRWFSANIGIHHVHHLSSRIPCYRLPSVLKDFPALRNVGRLTLWQSLECVPLTLWDDERDRLVSFKELRRRRAAQTVRVPDCHEGNGMP
jgi:acyl-lipid omega-6 desaturase (Delta-12 desaturase)